MTQNPHLSVVQSKETVLAGLSFDTTALTPLPIDLFDRRRGLQSTQIHQSVISEDGRIWSASPLGLVCYDGVTLRLFGRKNGLHCHGLRCLTQGPDNTLWLGSDAGVEILDITHTAPTSVKFSPIGIVDSLAISEEDGVVGTPNGLFCLNKNGEFRPSENALLSRVRITSTLVDKASNIWVTGPKFGLAVYCEHRWIFIPPETYPHIGLPQTLAIGADDTVLMGGDQGIAVLTADLQLSHSLKTTKPVTALHWHNNCIWMAVGDEIIRLTLDGNHIHAHDKVMEKTIIRDIVSDKFNNVWISTNDKGIQRISALRQIYNIEQRADLGAVFCIKDSTLGKLVGGARGLHLPNDRTVLTGITIWDTLQDKEGTIWAATQQGLFKYAAPFLKDSLPRTFNHQHEVLAAPSRAVIDYEGSLYVGSTKGLAKIDGDTSKEVLRPDGKSLGYVYSLHICLNGELWIATLGAGLWHLKNGRLMQVLGGPITQKSNVYALCHSADGTIYISHDGYISYINTNKVPDLFAYSREPIAAWALQAIGDDNLLAGTSNGFVIYDCKTREIIKRVANNTDTSNWEFTCSQSLHVDQDFIYCGVSSGLKTINLQKLMDIKTKPELTLAHITWHQAHPKFSNGTHYVDTGKWRFEVELQSCWYMDETDCQMRYRLVGFDQEWSTLRPIHKISYTSLPPGKYRLEACMYSPIAGTGPTTSLLSINVR